MIMKTEIKNLDEVVFEQRNQNYGAFFLRRSYNRHVTRALFFAVFLFLGIISIPLIASYMNKQVKVTIETTFDPTFLKSPVNDEIEKVKPQPEKTVERIQVFTAPEIVIDSNDVTNDLSYLMTGTTNDHPIDNDSALIVDEKPKVKPIDPLVPDKPFFSVDYMPSFKGGEGAMYDWLQKNVKYPRMAQEVNISGTVSVSFVVEKDGSISNVALMNDIGGTCGEEAMRVVKAMPKWNEGRQGNVPVRVQLVLPIRFVLQ
jgi:periplasmic protein TonB